MLRWSDVKRSLVVGFFLASASAVQADPIKLTGNVNVDFPQGNPFIATIVDNPVPANKTWSDPNDVYQANYPNGITPQQIQNYYVNNTPIANVTGFNIRDLRFAYDKASDTLSVGVNFFGIAGDPDGNGNPSTYSSPFPVGDPRRASDRGADFPNLTGNESIAVGFDLDGDLQVDYVAGVSSTAEQKAIAPGLIGYNYSVKSGTVKGFQALSDHSSFGPTVVEALGGLAFNPDAAHPHFEFTVANFTKSLGGDPVKGFYANAYAGNTTDLNFGEDTVPLSLVQIVPEPSTILAWSLLAAGFAIQVRRRRRFTV